MSMGQIVQNQLALQFAFATLLFASLSVVHTSTALGESKAQQVGSRVDSGYGRQNPTNGASAPRSNDMNKGAKSSKAQEMIGVGMNIVAAGMFAKSCAQTPSCPVCCLMAASSLMQAASMGSTAGKTQKAVDATQYASPDLGSGLGVDGTYDPTVSGSDSTDFGNANGNGLSSADSQRARGIVGQLSDAGYKVDPKKGTVTLPNGKTVPLDTLESTEQMKALGFSSQAIQAGENMRAVVAQTLQAKAQALAAQAAKAGSGEGEGVGGGGGRGIASKSESEQGEGFNPNSLFGEANKKTAQGVSGLSKQMGDSKIGVPQDNIFQMVSRQYTKQEGSSSFLFQPPVSAPRGVALPRATAGAAANAAKARIRK